MSLGKIFDESELNQGVWIRREIQLTRPALPYDYTCFADGTLFKKNFGPRHFVEIDEYDEVVNLCINKYPHIHKDALQFKYQIIHYNDLLTTY